jgi:two-component system sensor kinase FixL
MHLGDDSVGEDLLAGGQLAPATISEIQLKSVLDTAIDGIMIVDERAGILMFNRACERMFGYEAAEVVGRHVSVLFPEHANDAEFSFDAQLGAGRQQAGGSGREIRARRKDGSLFSLDLSVGEAVTSEGRHSIGILRDVSARIETERRLNELQADLVRLARISALDEMGLALAHELNQPLTAIMLYLQAAARELAREQGLGGDDRAQVILDKARREAHRAGSIIQRLRQLSEKRAPERKLIDLNAIVDDAVDLTVIGHDRTVRVVRDYEEHLPGVEADQIQVQQVVVNLVRNAFEAVRGRRDAEIVVATSLEERFALLSVTDNGPGIPPERHADLFRAFKTGKQSGMGLGLAISRTIVQSHGGELLVEPGGSGQGARFIVRLPLGTVGEPPPLGSIPYDAGFGGP